jgi:hypothetical protein
MVSKDQSIIMQVCAKIASELTPKTDNLSSNIMAFAEAYDSVCDIILPSQGLSTANAPAVATAPATQVAQAQSFPTPQAVAQDEAVFTNAFPSATATSTGTGFTVRIKGEQHGPIPAWLNEACAVKGVNEVWDNRNTVAANPKRPWFKSTTGNDAFWAPR